MESATNTISHPTSSEINKNMIAAYFERIGYNGPKIPSLETLRSIHFCHVQSIPFENLNPLCQWAVELDPESIHKKLVTEKRGGYCFEHNNLLAKILTDLGFQVKGLAARVMWNVPEEMVTARGHMLLLVTIDEKQYIADVGFGGLTLPVPLLLQTDVTYTTTHENFRVLEKDGEFFLESEVRNEWKALYRFSLQEHFLVDYEVTNYYLSTNPKSHFTHTLLAARIHGSKRYNLRNNQFTTHTKEESVRVIIEDKEELKRILISVFLINLPHVETLDEALSRIISHSVEG